MVNAGKTLGTFFAPLRLAIHFDGMNRANTLAKTAAGAVVIGKKRAGTHGKAVEQREIGRAHV